MNDPTTETVEPGVGVRGQVMRRSTGFGQVPDGTTFYVGGKPYLKMLGRAVEPAEPYWRWFDLHPVCIVWVGA